APRHDENTGCVYDFLWDKKGVDLRLRAGTVCRDCHAHIQQSVRENGKRCLAMFDSSVVDGYADLVVLLDELSSASKRELDILQRLESKTPADDGFDVFLCH